jgi:hypothetical protein
VKLLTHSTVLASALGIMGGLLALLAVVALSAPAQDTIKLWISFRAEHRKAATEHAMAMRWIRAATCGRRWTSNGASAVRTSAQTITVPIDQLSEIMLITRQDVTGGQTAVPTAAEHRSGCSSPEMAAGGPHLQQEEPVRVNGKP